MKEEVVHPSQNNQYCDLQSIQPACCRLNRKNYLNWSQLICTILEKKGKIGNLTAKEIWDAIEQAYSNAKDVARGNKSDNEYANQLKSLWMELDHYRVIKTKDAEDAAVLKEFIEQDRTMIYRDKKEEHLEKVNKFVAENNEDKANSPSLSELTSLTTSPLPYFSATSPATTKLSDDSPAKVEMERNFPISMGISSSTCTLAYSCMPPLSFGFKVSKTSSPSFWIYLVLDSRRTIGHAREGNGLYYLEEPCLSIIEKAHLSQSLMSKSCFYQKKLRFDNGKEYFNQVITSFYQKEDIIHESSRVKRPQYNGIAERKNGHLLDQSLAFLFQKNIIGSGHIRIKRREKFHKTLESQDSSCS
ncbi:hypothetical protein CR513_27198, partial [Mucuna pruriens]